MLQSDWAKCYNHGTNAGSGVWFILLTVCSFLWLANGSIISFLVLSFSLVLEEVNIQCMYCVLYALEVYQ